MRTIYFTVFLLFVSTCNALTPEQKEDIDALMKELRQCSNTAGVTLAIVSQEEPSYNQGYGFVDKDLSAPITTDTRFFIGSVTKHMTGILVSKLIDETEGLTWDTPVRDILGEDFYFSDGYTSAHASVRDLFSHRMGVPRHDYISILGFVDNAELVKRIRFLEPVSDFRTTFTYNNNMYGILGAVSEALGGASYAELMQTHLFEPLGMNTAFVYQPGMENIENIATSYAGIPPIVEESALPLEYYDSGAETVPAAGFIVAGPDDMSKWMNFMLSLGKNQDGVQVVSEEAMTRTRAPEVPTFSPTSSKPDDPETLIPFDRYAAGLAVGYYKGYSLLNHNGLVGGFTSQFFLYPDLDLGIAFTFSGHLAFPIEYIAAAITDIVLGEEVWITSSSLCSGTLSNLESPSVVKDLFDVKPDNMNFNSVEKGTPGRRLESYSGTYGNFGYGNVTVFYIAASDSLLMSAGSQGLYQLQPLGDDLFLPIGLNFISNSAPIGPSRFSSSAGNDIIDTFVLGSPHRPVFIRDRMLEDAPSPPNVECFQ